MHTVHVCVDAGIKNQGPWHAATSHLTGTINHYSKFAVPHACAHIWPWGKHKHKTKMTFTLQRRRPCSAAFTRVCIKGNTLFVDASSTCDGGPCHSGTWFNASRMDSPHEPHNSARFPKLWIAPRDAAPAHLARRPMVVEALLPSGISSACNQTSHLDHGRHQCHQSHALSNMAHLLYDHVLHELDIARVANVTVLLGESYKSTEPLNVVHALRQHQFSTATFRRASSGCFSRLHSYAWSCDRRLTRYTLRWLLEASGEALGAGLRHLRQLASEVVRSNSSSSMPKGTTSAKTLILYARTDAARRRLLNASTHRAALAARFEPRGWKVVLWDEVWATRPSVVQQIRLVSSAGAIITPHGTYPSVWGLFLPKDAVVVEIFSACFLYSWLARPVLRELHVRHSSISTVNTATLSTRHGARGSLRMRLVDPRNGTLLEKGKECIHPSLDSDILLDPLVLVQRMQQLLRDVER